MSLRKPEKHPKSYKLSIASHLRFVSTGIYPQSPLSGHACCSRFLNNTMRSDHPPLLSVPAFPLQTSTQGFETLIIRPHPVLRTWTSKRIPRSRKHCKCTDWNPNTLSKSPNYKPLESWPSFASGQIFHPCLLSFPVATCPKARCEVAMFNKLCASRSLR